MTPSKEDYLKAIYKLEAGQELVSNKQIAEALKIAPASVTEMLGKLKKDGLIHYEHYKGSRLTEAGFKAAVSLVRGHCLWEVFLVRHLGYSWSAAHEEAEHFEHAASPLFISRLDQFLGYPAYCPHGNVIPRPDGRRPQFRLCPLSQIPAGVTSHIRRVTEEKELLDYLQDIGITIGSSVCIRETAAYEGPLTLDLENKRVQISYKAAGQIFVEEGEGR